VQQQGRVHWRTQPIRATGNAFSGDGKKRNKGRTGAIATIRRRGRRRLFFDTAWEDGILYYQTKWAPNTEILVKIAEAFKVGFNSSYDEPGCGVFGEASYGNGELREVDLDADDIAQYEYYDGNDSYRFENRNYDCSEEILETLLKRKKAAIKQQDLNCNDNSRGKNN
jgi:hypothetical protein